VEIVPSMPLLHAALELATALDRSVYDCVYLALALATDSMLITADERFRAAISGSPFAASIYAIDAAG
jgi:predicted nucleic acid-binding protein